MLSYHIPRKDLDDKHTPWLCSCAKDSTAKRHRLSRHLFAHISGGKKSKIKVWAGFCFLLRLLSLAWRQMFPFFQCSSSLLSPAVINIMTKNNRGRKGVFLKLHRTTCLGIVCVYMCTHTHTNVYTHTHCSGLGPLLSVCNEKNTPMNLSTANLIETFSMLSFLFTDNSCICQVDVQPTWTCGFPLYVPICLLCRNLPFF